MTRLAVFYLLACAISWSLAAAYQVALALPVLGLFGPALAAIAVRGRAEGRPGVRALLASVVRWRVGVGPYGLAIVVPFGLALVVWAVHALLWDPTPLRLVRPGLIDFAIAVLIVGEELGWRGFLLPELLKRQSGLSASVVVGVLWGFWHLINFLIPGFPHYGQSLVAFLMTTVAYSVLFTVLHHWSGGSVLLASIFHSAINLVGPSGILREREQWLEPAVYGVAAVVALAWLGPGLGRRVSAAVPAPA